MPSDAAAYEKAKAPILGLYGGNDNRVNSTIDGAKAELAKRNVTYDPHVFDGAGHGFLRQQAGGEQAPGQHEGDRRGLAADPRIPAEIHELRNRVIW